MSIRLAQPEDFLAIEKVYNASKLDELKSEKQTFTLLPLSKDEKRKTLLQAMGTLAVPSYLSQKSKIRVAVRVFVQRFFGIEASRGYTYKLGANWN